MKMEIGNKVISSKKIKINGDFIPKGIKGEITSTSHRKDMVYVTFLNSVSSLVFKNEVEIISK